jgi:aconitate decarboxylase
MEPSIPARFETMHVLLTVELADGTLVETRCDGPRGMWGQPPIPDADHLVKVRDCLSIQLTPADVERCIELASSMERLAPPQVAELMSLVGTRNA